MSSVRRILYLGIDPPPGGGVIHYPVIRTEKIDSPQLEKARALWSRCTHAIFTSKNGVRHWPEDLAEKKTIAIGEATAGELRKRGAIPLLAPEATQEGVIALLETVDCQSSFFLYPHSKLARPYLGDYLKAKKIPCYAFNLYDTVFQSPEPKPILSDFDEILFTSPSTVHAFFQIFSSLPRRIALTPIGPVTKKALENIISPRIK